MRLCRSLGPGRLFPRDTPNVCAGNNYPGLLWPIGTSHDQQSLEHVPRFHQPFHRRDVGKACIAGPRPTKGFREIQLPISPEQGRKPSLFHASESVVAPQEMYEKKVAQDLKTRQHR